MNLQERIGALEEAVIALGSMEFGDVSGHEFHGNQWTGTDGRYEGLDHEKLVGKIGSNVSGKDTEHREVLRAALKGPVPSINDNDGKNLALRLAAELHAAGLSRNSNLNGAEIRGNTKSQGSTGFSFRDSQKYVDGKWVPDPAHTDVHMVISGKAAGLRYTETRGETEDEMAQSEPDDPARVRDKIAGVLEGMGMKVSEVRQTGYQLAWDDDVDYTAKVARLS